MQSERVDLIPTRQSLLSRLRDWSDDSSWNDFFQTYWKLIYSIALKAGLQDQEAQDVVQETVIAVSRKMPDFQYREGGSFKGWLMTITRWKIADQLRKRRSEDKRGVPLVVTTHNGRDEEVESTQPDLELEKLWNEEWEQNLIDAALEKTKLEVDPRHFQVFDLYCLKETPVKSISKGLKLSPARIYTMSHRVKKIYIKILKGLEKDNR
ncbi:MAG: polymerase, sigma-24 subunit, subfamily [Verrucomicrobiales bacterium]|nr:polymerase, sigma-24 subunit, subfamily [Verrucomicrobiales bacterium]